MVFRDFREYEQWKATREAELQNEEDQRIKEEHEKMEKKIQDDIELVTRKLQEEASEKRREMELEMKEKMRVRKTYKFRMISICLWPIHSHAYQRQYIIYFFSNFLFLMSSFMDFCFIKAIKGVHVKELENLEKEVKRVEEEAIALTKNEQEESRLVQELQAKISTLQ